MRKREDAGGIKKRRKVKGGETKGRRIMEGRRRRIDREKGSEVRTLE